MQVIGEKLKISHKGVHHILHRTIQISSDNLILQDRDPKHHSQIMQDLFSEEALKL